MVPSDNDLLQLRRYHAADHDEVTRQHHLGLEQFGADAGPGPWDDDLKDIPSHYFGPRTLAMRVCSSTPARTKSPLKPST
jgi:hypothetical protein